MDTASDLTAPILTNEEMEIFIHNYAYRYVSRDISDNDTTDWMIETHPHGEGMRHLYQLYLDKGLVEEWGPYTLEDLIEYYPHTYKKIGNPKDWGDFHLTRLTLKGRELIVEWAQARKTLKHI